MGMPSFFEAPRTHPIGVLATHVPLFVVGGVFAVCDFADGIIKVRGRGQVSSAADPLTFYFYATVVVIAAIVLLIRILQASVALAEKPSA